MPVTEISQTKINKARELEGKAVRNLWKKMPKGNDKL